MHSGLLVVAGVVLGSLFISASKTWLDQQEDVTFEDFHGADARKVVLIIGVMAAHAVGERPAPPPPTPRPTPPTPPWGAAPHADCRAGPRVAGTWRRRIGAAALHTPGAGADGHPGCPSCRGRRRGQRRGRVLLRASGLGAGHAGHPGHWPAQRARGPGGGHRHVRKRWGAAAPGQPRPCPLLLALSSSPCCDWPQEQRALLLQAPRPTGRSSGQCCHPCPRPWWPCPATCLSRPSPRCCRWRWASQRAACCGSSLQS
jgi:hypothetical protein